MLWALNFGALFYPRKFNRPALMYMAFPCIANRKLVSRVTCLLSYSLNVLGNFTLFAGVTNFTGDEENYTVCK